MSYAKLFAVAALAAVAGLSISSDQAQASWGDVNVDIDVAENGLRFSFDEDKVYPDGWPTYGSSFVTEGYMYPPGTLNGSDGVNADGSPEYPGSVIGKWTCRGFMIADGAYTATGAWTITTQTYEFTAGPYAGRMITTDGTELVDIGVSGPRAITGGTGAWNEADGQQNQTLQGFNATGGVDVDVELRIR